MEYETIIEKVGVRIGAAKPEQAEAAFTEVMTLLAERLPPEETRRLVSQLPQQIKWDIAQEASGAEYSAAEFIRKAAERLDTDTERAGFIVRGVFTALGEAVSAGELKDVLAALPPEYGELLQVQAQGPAQGPGEGVG